MKLMRIILKEGKTLKSLVNKIVLLYRALKS